MNHVHNETKEFVSVIITLGTNISGGETMFYDRVKTSDLGNRAHVLKHLHSKMIFGPFEKNSWRLSLGTHSINVLYSYKTNICAFLLS